MSPEEFFRGIQIDLERWRAERQQCLDQVRGILSRPLSGLNAPNDGELLSVISDLFHQVYTETPFGEEYDSLIERLSFTARELESVDAGELKTAWTRFLDGSEVEFEWPVNVGMAQWYEGRGMVAQAIAVYEHLYSELRGRLHDECSENLECWVMTLLYLCIGKGLYSRARHLCEVIEDYHNDGSVSPDNYAEAVLLQRELNHRAIKGAFESDRRSAEERLKVEHGALLDRLHHRTGRTVVDAELWSSVHWRHLEPGLAILHWSRALESEFHNKVFQRHRQKLLALPGFQAPRPGQTCGVGQMIFLLNCFGSNLGVKVVLAGLRGSDFLSTADGVSPLEKVRKHREAIAHVRDEPYTLEHCREFLAAIRDSGWVFEFLEALQPRGSSAHN